MDVPYIQLLELKNNENKPNKGCAIHIKKHVS
jgi:hypothetical protein